MESDETRKLNKDTNFTKDETPSRPLKRRLSKKESRLNQFLKDLAVNTEQHKARSIFLRTIQDSSSIIYNQNNRQTNKMAAHEDTSLVDNIFDSVLKDSLHRRIRRLTADIEDNIKLKESKESTKLPPVIVDSHINLETPRIAPRAFSPVEKQSAKMFLEKIKAFKERRRKVCHFMYSYTLIFTVEPRLNSNAKENRYTLFFIRTSKFFLRLGCSYFFGTLSLKLFLSCSYF